LADTIILSSFNLTLLIKWVTLIYASKWDLTTFKVHIYNNGNCLTLCAVLMSWLLFARSHAESTPHWKNLMMS